MRKIFCFLLIAAIAVQINAKPADAPKPTEAAKAAAATTPKPALPAIPPLDPKSALPALKPLGVVQEIAKVGTTLLETGEKCIGGLFGLGKMF